MAPPEAGLQKGHLMSLAGRRSRTLLSRYGAADEWAPEAHGRLSLGDRL